MIAAMRGALVIVILVACGAAPPTPPPSVHAQLAASGEMAPPAEYRHWTFLSSGLGMTYGPFAAPAGAPPNFDTVFVDPASYDAFRATGSWRDGTTFVV